MSKSSYSRIKNAFNPIDENAIQFMKKYAQIGKTLMEQLENYLIFGKWDDCLTPENEMNIISLVKYFNDNKYTLLKVECPIDENDDWNGFIDVIAKNEDNKNILFEIKIRKDDKVELDTVIQTEFYFSMINEIEMYDYKILHLIRSTNEVVEVNVPTEQKFAAQAIIQHIKEVKRLWKK